MIDKDFFKRPADKVAKSILGNILEFKGKKVKIVETEAYFGKEDPASRARQNGDLRKTMLMSPGTILVYGVHNSWLINFVTSNKGKAEAVLIRAGEPLNFEGGLSGPGKLTKNLGIDKSLHKKRIGKKLKIMKGENIIETNIESSNRIGVSEDLDRPMRFFIKDNCFVSK